MLGFFLCLNKTEIYVSYDIRNCPLQKSACLMNTNLTKYLSDVFRNEVEYTGAVEPKESNLQASAYLLDRNINQFIVDKKFSLGLDEII